MSTNADTNKWAPKLVIALQLATWSAVGLMLVRRGAICLRGGKEGRANASDIELQVIVPSQYVKTGDRTVKLNVPTTRVYRAGSWSGQRAIEKKEELLRDYSDEPLFLGTVTRAPSDRKERTLAASGKSKIQAVETALDNDKTLRKEETYYTVSHTEPVLMQTNLGGDIPGSTDKYDMTKLPKRGKKHKGKAIRGMLHRKNFTESSRGIQRERGNVSRVGESQDPAVSSRRPVSRAGAAVAIVMLTIGIVMLLLGPSIVILRALDARRRRRRYGRHSRAPRGGKDLPPTYEQATLMDQAPRYSTLRLNALLDP